MIQSILFVLGPAVALFGVGAGAVYAAAKWVQLVVVPKGRLNEKRLREARKTADQIEANARHYNRTDAVTAQTVLAIEANELLRDQMPDELLRQFYALTEDRPRQLPEGGRP